MIGTYYYPEQWPAKQWKADFERIKQMGLGHVHMGEFAWAHMEPEENRFEFEWLDQAVEQAKQAGLKIILCTPTAAPPVWLSQTYPETLPVKANGRRVTHGSRAHRCVNSAVFNRLAERIATQLALHYGDDPDVIGWQVDNELGHYHSAPCYCLACLVHFRQHLQTRYQTIGALNHAWAGDFWSQRYDDFEQIELPNPETLGYLPNEHARLDFLLFYSVSLARFIERQARILRAHLHAGAWITHNFIAGDRFCDPRHVAPATLDFFSITMYPVSGEYGGTPQTEQFRIGDPMAVAHHCDVARGHNGRWGLMELQPGQVNWGPFNCRPYPGAVRLWLWTAIAHGAELLDTYRFRQPVAGCEQYHAGLLALDGQTPAPGGEEFQQVAAELDRIGAYLTGTGTLPLPRAAIYFDWTSSKALEIHPQSLDFDAAQCWLRFYSALKTLGFAVDIIDSESDLTPYGLVCTALVDLAPDALLARWRQYIENGGHLLAGPRTATRLPNGHFPQTTYGRRLARLVKAELSGYDVLPAGHTGTIELLPGGRKIAWHSWSEQWRPDGQSTILAVHRDQFYQGACAAFQTRVGKGAATVVGFDAAEGIRATVAAGLDALGQTRVSLPPRCLYQVRGRLGIFLNFNAFEVKLPASLVPAEKSALLIGQTVVPAADVAVWLND